MDLPRRRLRIEESVTEVNGVLVRSAPKDHQRRSVPFPPFLADLLAARIAGRDSNDPVVASNRGGVLRARNMRRDWFDAAAVSAGVAGLTPHELRHTAASLAVSAGASVLGVQRMLGHDKASTTLDIYSDLFDADLDAVADRLADTRSRPLADSLRTKVVLDLSAETATQTELGKRCALGAIRTRDTRFRRAVLYPLSYEGGATRGSRWDERQVCHGSTVQP